MADIYLRFHKDMLVLSTSVASALERQGADAERDLDFMNLIEPDSIRDFYRLELVAGAQCLVLGTKNMTPAQLAQHGMEDRAFELSVAAFTVAAALKPQHMLVEICPCGLPFDASDKNSLVEHKNQYVEAARVFEKSEFDAYLLNDFTDVIQLKCALMGLRQVTDRPVFAAVALDEEGKLPRRGTWAEALDVMAEYGAQVVGFTTNAPVEKACAFCEQAVAQAPDLPILAQLEVVEHNERAGVVVPDDPYYCADTMADAALRLRAAGAQFLRAVGQATPAYSGVLAATLYGMDVAPERFQD